MPGAATEQVLLLSCEIMYAEYQAIFDSGAYCTAIWMLK
jgi:hypothetical protein